MNLRDLWWFYTYKRPLNNLCEVKKVHAYNRAHLDNLVDFRSPFVNSPFLLVPIGSTKVFNSGIPIVIVHSCITKPLSIFLVCRMPQAEQKPFHLVGTSMGGHGLGCMLLTTRQMSAACPLCALLVSCKTQITLWVMWTQRDLNLWRSQWLVSAVTVF